MAKFLVYNCSGELDDISHLFPNERLARIAALVAASGQPVDLIDRANYRDLQRFGSEYLQNLGALGFYETNALYESTLRDEAQYLLDQGYDVVFLNLWHGTGFKFSMDLANQLKQARPDTKIYGVGQKIDWFKEHILTFSGDALDGLVMGLGYNAIAAIVRGEDIAHCPNTIVKRDGMVVVNEKTAINVDDYPIGIYDASIYHGIEGKLPIHTVTLSNQACPNYCVFCVRPENYGRTSIRRDITLVLNEMAESYEKHGIRHFRFEDSTPPQGALTDIARAIAGSEFCGKITFTAFSRIDTNRAEDFELLKQAGCLALFFGIESLDDQNLVRLRKGITFDGIKDTVRRAHEAGIRTVASFIMPTPGETEETIEHTIRRVAEVRDILDSLLALPAGVYPPTEWGINPEKYGILLDEDYLERFVTYPIKYLIPFKYWPRMPFRYAMLGKPAEDVDPSMIVEVFETFQGRIQREFALPCIPDYYFLLAHYLGQDHVGTTRQLITLMVNRDYAGLETLLCQPTPAP